MPRTNTASCLDQLFLAWQHMWPSPRLKHARTEASVNVLNAVMTHTAPHQRTPLDINNAIWQCSRIRCLMLRHSAIITWVTICTELCWCLRVADQQWQIITYSIMHKGISKSLVGYPPSWWRTKRERVWLQKSWISPEKGKSHAQREWYAALTTGSGTLLLNLFKE